MPRFKYRNLLIHMLPQRSERTAEAQVDCDFFASCGWTICLGCTGWITEMCGISGCRACTLQISQPPPCDFNCSEIPSGACFPCTNISPLEARRRVARPEDLAVLKDRLRQALAQVEAQEEALEERLRPRTVAEAEELEDQLSGALDQVREDKQRLERRESEETDEQ